MRKDVSREQSLEFVAKFAQHFPFNQLSSKNTQNFIKNPKYFCGLFAKILIDNEDVILKPKYKQKVSIPKPTVDMRIEQLKELFEQKSQGRFKGYVSENLYEFEIELIKSEKRIEFIPIVKTVERSISEKALAFQKQVLKLPFIQALELVIDLIENNKLPDDGMYTAIFLKTKNMNGNQCLIQLSSGSRENGPVMDIRQVRDDDSFKRVIYRGEL